jgi:NAD(P)-dependent dehydrogenase (short-subunit alcohol dehydrogenase family)
VQVWIVQSKNDMRVEKGETMEFEGKKALVTGGTSGIGRAAALQLAALGAEVTISGRDAERGAETVAAIEAAGGSARFIAADLADFGAIGRLAEEVGEVDVLVNNAGAFDFVPATEETRESYERMFDVNVRAPYFLTAALAPRMAGRGGAIVNVSTMVAELGMPGSSAYAATKAALASLTRTWAVEFAASGVRVNAVTVGPTIAGGTANMSEDELGFVTGLAQLGRLAEASEIAETIVFLASPRSSYMTGANLAADGGATAVLH